MDKQRVRILCTCRFQVSCQNGSCAHSIVAYIGCCIQLAVEVIDSKNVNLDITAQIEVINFEPFIVLCAGIRNFVILKQYLLSLRR
ncbi:hypothetical protein D3C73_1361230 [compost metagenome]